MASSGRQTAESAFLRDGYQMAGTMQHEHVDNRLDVRQVIDCIRSQTMIR